MTYCYCSRCELNFTSLTSFDKHLGRLVQNVGYQHLAPEDCGLVRTDRGISLPPPVRPLRTEEWAEIFKKEQACPTEEG